MRDSDALRAAAVPLGAVRAVRERAVDLTVVIPCLNEEENIGFILDQVRDTLRSQTFTWEIVIVDDQSDDRTYAIAEKWISDNPAYAVEVIRRSLHRRGYGAAVRYGTAYGHGRYCIFVSADAVDPIQMIPGMYDLMEAGASLAQCSRYLHAGDDKTIPFKYKFFQFFFRLGVKIALGQYIPDSTYAFKMFRRREILGAGLNQNRFSISPEITFKCILMGGEIKYMPGSQGVRSRGVSKFIFRKEGMGFGYCLFRAFLHRLNAIFWF